MGWIVLSYSNYALSWLLSWQFPGVQWCCLGGRALLENTGVLVLHSVQVHSIPTCSVITRWCISQSWFPSRSNEEWLVLSYSHPPTFSAHLLLHRGVQGRFVNFYLCSWQGGPWRLIVSEVHCNLVLYCLKVHCNLLQVFFLQEMLLSNFSKFWQSFLSILLTNTCLHTVHTGHSFFRLFVHSWGVRAICTRCSLDENFPYKTLSTMCACLCEHVCACMCGGIHVLSMPHLYKVFQLCVVSNRSLAAWMTLWLCLRICSTRPLLLAVLIINEVHCIVYSLSSYSFQDQWGRWTYTIYSTQQSVNPSRDREVCVWMCDLCMPVISIVEMHCHLVTVLPFGMDRVRSWALEGVGKRKRERDPRNLAPPGSSSYLEVVLDDTVALQLASTVLWLECGSFWAWPEKRDIPACSIPPPERYCIWHGGLSVNFPVTSCCLGQILVSRSCWMAAESSNSTQNSNVQFIQLIMREKVCACVRIRIDWQEGFPKTLFSLWRFLSYEPVAAVIAKVA